MQANDLLKYRDKIINAFKQGTFLSESSKKESKDVQNNFELEDVNKFIPKIESISKNINPSFFNEFFESSPADYAKYLINLKNLTENKEFVTVAKKQNIKFKRQNKRNERKGKKNNNADETQKNIKEILDYNRQVQKAFALTSKIKNTESELKPEESIAERVKLRRQKSEKKEPNDFLRQIKEEQKNIEMSLFRSKFIYKMPA